MPDALHLGDQPELCATITGGAGPSTVGWLVNKTISLLQQGRESHALSLNSSYQLQEGIFATENAGNAISDILTVSAPLHCIVALATKHRTGVIFKRSFSVKFWDEKDKDSFQS